MEEPEKKNIIELTEHFFRNEYGKIVSVLTRYVGTDNVETAEDIVQETLLKAADSWEINGIPDNPQGWLYTTAKNLAINTLKRKKYQQKYEHDTKQSLDKLEEIQFSEEQIMDEQLKMMFVCCHSSISENSQIALILKILCGFSIAEIANGFFTTNETINKRLVRGRKQLRKNKVSFELPKNINKNLTIVLKTIYLLFNEGYNPSQKNELIRYDLCLEAIRLAEIITTNLDITEKTDSYALLALMYFNASRFEARMSNDNSLIEMEMQDRTKWNKELIQKGIQYLEKAQQNKVSHYLILATISANHCIAKNFEDTNWEEILSLYDSLIILEDSPIIRLNRSVALAKVKGNNLAIVELENLESNSDIGKYYLFHTTLAELYKLDGNAEKAAKKFKKAISLATNERDADFIKKKLLEVVPIY
jgi:RNA polymerase sigma factor (sigma-70 family)